MRGPSPTSFRLTKQEEEDVFVILSYLRKHRRDPLVPKTEAIRYAIKVARESLGDHVQG